MKEPFTVFKKIKRARILSGLSQKDIASKIGVSDKTISAYETGRAIPPIPILTQIAQITNVSVSEIVGVQENKNNAEENKLLEKLENMEERLSNLEQLVVKLLKNK